MAATAVDVLVPTRDRAAAAAALASIEAVRAAEPELDLRVHVVEDPEGRGAAWARNRAAEQGDAQYIALLDDDDEWLAPRLTRAVEILRKKPAIALVAGDAILAGGRRFLASQPPPGGEGRDHGALALDCTICTSTVTLRRADWGAGMDESLPLAEDYELWLRLTRDGRRAHILPDPLVRRGPDRASADPVAMARYTLAALERSADMPEGDEHVVANRRTRAAEGVRVWRDRRGRLRGVYAHGLAKDGQYGPALEQALRAVREAPAARVAWTSLIRAGLRIP